MAGARGLIAAAMLLLLNACGAVHYEPTDSATREQILAVGSSTVYPFTTSVAEQFARKRPEFRAPIVESTGTGAGIKLFCSGVGARYPDVANASRRIKKGEVEDCAETGVDRIIELQIGVDGLAIAESNRGESIKLTREELYRALAANPYGKAQTAETWADVNPALPAIRIQVYGPPPTSGTRDSFNELILEKGCDANPAMEALKESDADKHKEICTKIREDGAFIESGENDNLIVQKLVANPDAIGVFGYSFLEENFDRLHGVELDGVPLNNETISNFKYPGARALYIYVKAAHLRAVPGLADFVAEYARSWNPGTYLVRRGLIASPDDVRAKNAEIAARFTPLDPAEIK